MAEADRRFPFRIKLGLPTVAQLAKMRVWLDENCGSHGWAMSPARLRGASDNAVAVYFRDPALAAAFVFRWCAGSRIEISEGAFRVRKDRLM